MKSPRALAVLLALLLTPLLACKAVTGTPNFLATPTAITPTRTPIPSMPVQPGAANPNEPVVIVGEVAYTSPFFVNSLAEPFVMLEDQAGFVQRDKEFLFPAASQVIGPVVVQEDQSLTYELALPSVPQGTFVDVDQDGQADTGVQVFAVAYWSNTWGDPFLEERDGTGWSSAYASTITDPEKDNEIKGGFLVVWAPDEAQSFPTSFGPDGLLFTADDPTSPLPAGYNLVDLSQNPFRLWKEARPQIDLLEGEVAVNDFSNLSYSEAFQALFDKVSREYPFTQQKSIQWQALYEKYAPRIEAARNKQDFYRALRDFAWEIPDGHVNLSFDPDLFFQEAGGGFGLVLTELSNGSLIVTQVIPDSPAAQAGIEVGANILAWDGKTVQEALSQVTAYLGPYSTEHARRATLPIFLQRAPVDQKVQVQVQNSPEGPIEEKTLTAAFEYDSLQAALISGDELDLPISGEILNDSGLGYIRITTFSSDYNLMARLWEHYLQGMNDLQVPGLILDLRHNGGGSTGLAQNFAGYFFDQEVELSQEEYFNDLTQQFELQEPSTRIKPGPFLYKGQVAVLVGPDCISACEGFAYALTQNGRSIVVGHTPSAGAYGEVGRGQYKLPEDLTMQFPTGRSLSPSGEIILEGVGVPPDVVVPVTRENVLSSEDAVLQAAIQELLDNLR